MSRFHCHVRGFLGCLGLIFTRKLQRVHYYIAKAKINVNSMNINEIDNLA